MITIEVNGRSVEVSHAALGARIGTALIFDDRESVFPGKTLVAEGGNRSWIAFYQSMTDEPIAVVTIASATGAIGELLPGEAITLNNWPT